ncbi:MAG: hypothetical protein ACP5UN_03440 [Candidatus Micrarchaeia archaeon]
MQKRDNTSAKKSKEVKSKALNTTLFLNVEASVQNISSSKAICSFCGAESLAASSSWICEHCECINSEASKLFSDDPKFKLVLSALSSSDVDKLSQTLQDYERLANVSQDNRFFYALGFLYMRLSDLYLSNLRYDRKDFMYENTLLRYNATSAESRAKLFLFKAAKHGDSVESIFTSFIAYIKLGRLKDAKRVLELLSSIRIPRVQSLIKYASIIFYIESKDYDSVIKSAGELINERCCTANVAYYLAYALYKTRKYEKALRILKILSSIMSNSKATALKDSIEARK